MVIESYLLDKTANLLGLTHDFLAIYFQTMKIQR